MAFILTKDRSTSNYSKLKRGCALNQSIGNIMRQIRVRFLLFFWTSANFPATSSLLWRDFLFRLFAVVPRYTVRDCPMTRLTTIAAMPASTALAIGDVKMSVIALEPDACP